MASFNLGRIQGEKGEKGDTGAKGERGEKGEKGEPGERGRDALTPVFSVGKTVTLLPYEEAYVQIDTTDVSNPVMTFGIPGGKDGKDACGDMNAYMYDPQGKKQDIFAYVQSFAENFIKKTGGKLEGELTAYESELSRPYVRNVTVGTELPEVSANGDLCIITEDVNVKKLGDCPVGMSFIAGNEAKPDEYIIAAKDYHGSGTVTLVKKELTSVKLAFDRKNTLNYIMSDVDLFLECIYSQQLPGELKSILLEAETENGFLRKCFLLSHKDFENIEYFNTAENRCACKSGSEAKGVYITRTAPNSRTVYAITETGIVSSISQNTESYLRPTIILSSGTAVENTEHNSSPAVRLCTPHSGIYVYIDGLWKECVK